MTVATEVLGRKESGKIAEEDAPIRLSSDYIVSGLSSSSICRKTPANFVEEGSFKAEIRRSLRLVKW